MAADSPGVVTSYVEAEPPEAVELLRRGEVDVAITFSHAPQDDDVLADPTLSARVLGRDPLALVTPAGTGGAEAVADLALQRDARWIGGCPRCRGHLLASCAASGFTPDIVLETDNAAAVVGLVAAGLGVALLPRLALTTTVVPPGVAVTPASDELARRVEVVVARGPSGCRVSALRSTRSARPPTCSADGAGASRHRSDGRRGSAPPRTSVGASTAPPSGVADAPRAGHGGRVHGTAVRWSQDTPRAGHGGRTTCRRPRPEATLPATEPGSARRRGTRRRESDTGRTGGAGRRRHGPPVRRWARPRHRRSVGRGARTPRSLPTGRCGGSPARGGRGRPSRRTRTARA